MNDESKFQVKVLQDICIAFMATQSLSACLQSGKASLGDDLYKVLTLESSSVDEMFISLNLKSENNALEVINRLEAAVFAWKGRLTEQASGKSPVRKSWSFIKDPMSEMDKMELLVDRAEALLHQIKSVYPSLPQTFLDATKIQYGKASSWCLK